MYQHKFTFPSEEQMRAFQHILIITQQLHLTGSGGDTQTWFEICYESVGSLSRRSVQGLAQAANLHGGVFYSNWPVRRREE